jgi:membrane protein YdbS with pleckstrin-like domain
MPEYVDFPNPFVRAVVNGVITAVTAAVAFIVAHLLLVGESEHHWSVSVLGTVLVLIFAVVLSLLFKQRFRFGSLEVHPFLGGDRVAEHGSNPELHDDDTEGR